MRHEKALSLEMAALAKQYERDLHAEREVHYEREKAHAREMQAGVKQREGLVAQHAAEMEGEKAAQQAVRAKIRELDQLVKRLRNDAEEVQMLWKSSLIRS